MKNMASKLALGSVLLGSLVVMACASDADIAKVQGNQNGASSGSPTGTTAATSVPTATGSSTAIDAGTPDAATSCNAVAQEATTRTHVWKHLPAPVAQGGAFADGVYVLSATAVYDDKQLTFPYDTPTSSPSSWTVEIKGGLWLENSNGVHSNLTLAAGKTPASYASTVTCDGAKPGSPPFVRADEDYTATANSFSLFSYSTGGGGNPVVEIWTWTKIR